MVMMKYMQVIKDKMEQDHISITELAKKSNLEVDIVTSFLKGKRVVSIEEFAKIVSILHLDINKVLDIQVNNKDTYMLYDEIELEINRIARSISEDQRGKFIRAVMYLAECFEEDKDKTCK